MRAGSSVTEHVDGGMTTGAAEISLQLQYRAFTSPRESPTTLSVTVLTSSGWNVDVAEHTLVNDSLAPGHILP
jgi:hypothetical protein